MLTRHFIDVDGQDGGRRVHYRRYGQGPALLMVHQSPRSSAEYEPLMLEWGKSFTCIAPDTPGFGQSDPLPGEPEIGDFARALLDTCDALGLDHCPAYGFHSGAVILMAALRQQPNRFTRVAMGGYAVWTAEEMATFSSDYLPPLIPTDYGEHLTWLWNRMLEQSWFFPWFDTRGQTRLRGAHADVEKVHGAVMEMLDAGNSYRAGYGAVLRAPRAIPSGDRQLPEVLITAYDGDPLQAHLERLGSLPSGWAAHPVGTPEQHRSESLRFLSDAPAGDAPPVREVADQGFARVSAGTFAGLIHWRGRGDTLHLHAPGAEATSGETGTAIDLPGHGFSDDWPAGAEPDLGDWRSVVADCSLKLSTIETKAEGFSAALIEGERPSAEAAERLIPDLTPDRFGAHLTRAWAVVRAGRFFDPWYQADAAHARPFTAEEIQPAAIANDTRALLRARAGRRLMKAIAA